MEAVSYQLPEKYQVLEQIGRGGMADVYRARDTRLGREVAVKVLRAPMQENEEARYRFEREAAVIASLTHPHIVRVYDFDTAAATYYLVLEYIAGITLAEALRREEGGAPFSLAEVAQIFEQLADAVDYAHTRGIIHRDLKPSNIMFRPGGELVLADFGIAHLVDVTRYTDSGVVIGTYAYMAPEQCRGQRPDARSDIYALALILYEMLAGRRPFISDRPAGLLYKHVHDTPPPLAAFNPTVPANVEQVVLRGLQKEPEARYASAAEMAAALAAAIADPATPALPPTPELSPVEAEEDADTPRSRGKVTVTLYQRPGVFEKPTHLFGRERLIEAVRPLLAEGEQVLLNGLGGAGKTAVAATLADRFLVDAAGSVIWIPVGMEGIEAIVEGLADHLAAGEEEKQALKTASGSTRLQHVRALLERYRPALLVLDDVWEGEVLKLLRAVPRDMPVLVTSRHRFPVQRIVDVDDLAPPAALALLAYHAGQREFQADTAARELCELLGYHAYALEIAGNTLKVDQRTPRQLMKRLVEAPHELQMPAGLTEMGRESVSALLDSSFNALSWEERLVFLAFGTLFAPGATPALLREHVPSTVSDLEQILTTLVRRSLVKRRTAEQGDLDFYFVHDLTFHYVQDKSRQQGEEPAAAIGSTYRYLEQHLRDFDRLDLDLPHLLGAARAAGAEEPLYLVQMMSLLAIGGYPRPEGPSYMDMRGHSRRLLRRLDEAILLAGAMGLEEVQHYLWGKRGNADLRRGEYEAARQSYGSALALAPNPHRQILLLSLVGTVRGELGEQEGDALLQEAYELANKGNDKSALCFVLQKKSYRAAQRGDFEATRRFAAEAVGLAREQENIDLLVKALMNLGSAELDLGNAEKAVSLHREGLALVRAEGNLALTAHFLQAIAEDLHELGQVEAATATFGEALTIHTQTGDRGNVAQIRQFCQEKGINLKESA